MHTSIFLLLVTLTGFTNIETKDNDATTKFLIESVDARMMDLEEGKLASERGTTPEIRNYGKLMIDDQTMLLEKIRELAKLKKVDLPSAISNRKMRGLKNLKKKSGKSFDKRFMYMITIDHKRDVRIFKKATEIEDVQVKAFAKEYLPLIQSHLDKIRSIKEST